MPSRRDLRVSTSILFSVTTLLFLHAHPDDESILTGATIAKAKANGARVVVAFASQGDAGETNADLGGESIGDRREHEARAACESLGVDRVVFLGYRDSGMVDTDTTEHASHSGAKCHSSGQQAIVSRRTDS